MRLWTWIYVGFIGAALGSGLGLLGIGVLIMCFMFIFLQYTEERSFGGSFYVNDTCHIPKMLSMRMLELWGNLWLPRMINDENSSSHLGMWDFCLSLINIVVC